jgi:serine phosphatase RsbU (regulator of sigma subunit)
MHSVANCAIVIGMYVGFNVSAGMQFTIENLLNNLFFLVATATIAISINHVKYKQVKKEFSLMAQLSDARDALWSEMELAKRIQTALLPDDTRLPGWEIAATTIPTKQVGGDYYDIIETDSGRQWVSMGDVSGHGVDSGLVMMMAQTSIYSIVNDAGGNSPSSILASVNRAIRENIERLGSDHYMTLSLLHLEDSTFTVAGRHQDLLLYRDGENRTEVVPTRGTWLGIAEDISGFLEDTKVSVARGDTILLFTDGVTEATSSDGELFGQSRLEAMLQQHADLTPSKLCQRIVAEVESFQEEQSDDITVVILRKL